MSNAFQRNYETELAIANLIPARVQMSQTTESTAEDPRRCTPAIFQGQKGVNFGTRSNIYSADYVWPVPYFRRDICNKDTYDSIFVRGSYVSQKDGKTFVVTRVPDTNVQSRFGWGTSNTYYGTKSAGIVTGSYGCDPNCGKAFQNKWAPSWYKPECSP
ncbi:conserved hypothetical protein [Lausannevirus]|uniref:Uncharacterized protein n=1 Tax=Lausannevirus TaxID=999883 RepID=F2WM12_9VIRU|nr:hypothetical protein LAU_0435 [Lausannevirus]AEA07285.1 conserved hypothetical protein [Lausannevirus]